MNKVSSRSPLKAPLLRLPGQSIDEQMNHILNEKQVNYSLFAFGFFLLAVAAWIQVFTHSQLNPWIFSAVAILGIGYCVFGVWQTAKEVKRLSAGQGHPIFPLSRKK